MFHIRDEGEKAKPGFNFYPLRSGLFGFLFVGRDGVDFFAYISKKNGRIAFHRFRNF